MANQIACTKQSSLELNYKTFMGNC